jgi:hypothetical protein
MFGNQVSQLAIALLNQRISIWELNFCCRRRGRRTYGGGGGGDAYYCHPYHRSPSGDKCGCK